MFTKIKITEDLNAIKYDNKGDIRIQISYPKNNLIKEREAIMQFWKEYERLRINSLIVKNKKL
jgi:hypothetical protein